MGKLAGLAKEQRRALDRLKRVRGIERFYLAGGTAIAVHSYAPLDAPTPGPEEFPLASLRDLAAMKLAAIARRGLRRDFWDLQAIAEAGLSLQETANAYLVKYGVSDSDLYHVLRALTYFGDAEKDPVYPRGLTPAKWERIKTFFLAEAPKLLLGA